MQSMGDEDFCISPELESGDVFLGRLGLSFRQRFLILTQSMGAEDFCVSPEHGSGDDLWVGWDSVFVNDL